MVHCGGCRDRRGRRHADEKRGSHRGGRHRGPVETFEEATITGSPFDLYIGALAMWSAVSFGWILGGMGGAGLTIVGYGWFAIAAYGVIVGIGIAKNHREDVATAVDPTKSLETELDK